MSSADIRAKLNHPVIDADGHMLEYMPVYQDFLKQVAGPDVVKRYFERAQTSPNAMWYALTPEQRRNHRVGRPPYWPVPTSQTLDHATSMLPRLLKERLDEFGFDFCIAYPTLGFFLFDEPDEELRRAGCRAQNLMVADLFADVKDCITPAATIPTHTPDEAIAELDHAVGELGLKATMVASVVPRTITAGAGGKDDGERAMWIDCLGLDSEYDYDPLWQRCMDLGVAPTAHSFMQGHGWRRSISTYMYNQTGHFAEAGEAFAKAIFFGGVTKRFPDLRFGVLEGGVGWAITTFATLVEVWQKRGMPGIKNLDPAKLDLKLLGECFDRYGGEAFAGKIGTDEGPGYSSLNADGTVNDPDVPFLDEFAAAGIEKAEDIVDRFVKPMWFGCEANDVMVPLAFSGAGVPFGTKMKAILGSDIGHWDVPAMAGVLAEAYEQVENGLMTADDFRNFTFTNPAALHSGMNPNFFKGTRVEAAVDALLDGQGLAGPATSDAAE